MGLFTQACEEKQQSSTNKSSNRPEARRISRNTRVNVFFCFGEFAAVWESPEVRINHRHESAAPCPDVTIRQILLVNPTSPSSSWTLPAVFLCRCNYFPAASSSCRQLTARLPVFFPLSWCSVFHGVSPEREDSSRGVAFGEPRSPIADSPPGLDKINPTN